MLLSIIVPTYNAEAYIRKCLNSLVNQNIIDYEIIIINDGSTDNTVRVVEEYIAEQNNIRLISQRNQGQGQARNIGINLAKGEYIMFVDSDDYLEFNSIKLLIDRMTNDKLDMLCGDYRKVDNTGNSINKSKMEQNIVYTSEVINSSRFLDKHFGFLCYTYLFVYKKQFIINLGAQFKSGIYYEDAEWLSRVIPYAERIGMINSMFYNYVQTPNSSMRDESRIEKRLQDLLTVTRSLLDFKENNVKDLKIKTWFDEMISINIIMVCNMVADKNMKHHQKNVKELIMELDVFPLKIKRMPLKFIIMSFMINMNVTLSILALSMKNAFIRK